MILFWYDDDYGSGKLSVFCTGMREAPMEKYKASRDQIRSHCTFGPQSIYHIWYIANGSNSMQCNVIQYNIIQFGMIKCNSMKCSYWISQYPTNYFPFPAKRWKHTSLYHFYSFCVQSLPKSLIKSSLNFNTQPLRRVSVVLYFGGILSNVEGERWGSPNKVYSRPDPVSALNKENISNVLRKSAGGHQSGWRIPHLSFVILPFAELSLTNYSYLPSL